MSGPAVPRDPDVPSGHRGAAGAVGLAEPVTASREARLVIHGHRRVADVVSTVLLLVLLVVESAAAGGGIVFLSMAFHSCAAPGNTCDLGLGSAVVSVGPVLVALVLVVTLLGCTLRLVRRRLAWPVALVGIAAQVVVFSAALLLVDSAVRHGF